LFVVFPVAGDAAPPGSSTGFSISFLFIFFEKERPLNASDTNWEKSLGYAHMSFET